MRKPDPATHIPSNEYLRKLIALSGMTHKDVAEQLGIPSETFRRYAGKTQKQAVPYLVQYAVEQLVEFNSMNINEMRLVLLTQQPDANHACVQTTSKISQSASLFLALFLSKK